MPSGRGRTRAAPFTSLGANWKLNHGTRLVLPGGDSHGPTSSPTSLLGSFREADKRAVFSAAAGCAALLLGMRSRCLRSGLPGLPGWLPGQLSHSGPWTREAGGGVVESNQKESSLGVVLEGGAILKLTGASTRPPALGESCGVLGPDICPSLGSSRKE